MSLRGMVPPDPQTDVSQVRFAVIFTPRPSRKRYPAGCVEIFATVEEAIQVFRRAVYLLSDGMVAGYGFNFLTFVQACSDSSVKLQDALVCCIPSPWPSPGVPD